MGSVISNKNIVTDITRNTFVKIHAANLPVLFGYKNVLLREEGDFIISDNLAVGHKAAPGTQLPRDVFGSHVSHCTNIKGNVPPAK